MSSSGAPALRVLELTRFVGVGDVVAAVGCSQRSAYRMMTEAAKQAGLPGKQHGLKRLPQLVWERYAAQRFGCPSPASVAVTGMASPASMAFPVRSNPPAARTGRRQKAFSGSGNGTPQIRTVQLRSGRRSMTPSGE